VTSNGDHPESNGRRQDKTSSYYLWSAMRDALLLAERSSQGETIAVTREMAPLCFGISQGILFASWEKFQRVGLAERDRHS